MSARAGDRPFRGIAYILASVLAFAFMNLFAKGMMARYDVLQIVFFRSLFILLPCFGVILWQRKLAFLRTSDPWGHFWRGLMGTSSMLCLFYAILLLPLADSVAVGFLGPAFATLAAMIFLREKAGWARWGALAAGLAGVLIMVQPGGEAVNPLGRGVALLGSLLFGLTMMWVRLLGRTEPALTIVFYFALFATVAMGATLPFVWVTPGWLDLLCLVMTGFSGFWGQVFVTKAYQYAPAATVSPFNYTALIWAALFGYLLWDEVPTPEIMIGACIVAVAGIFTACYEAREIRRGRSLPG